MYIYKIPIYVEVEIEGECSHLQISKAVDKFVASHVQDVVEEIRVFPNSYTNDFDTTAELVRGFLKVKRVRLSVISKSQAFKRISEK